MGPKLVKALSKRANLSMLCQIYGPNWIRPELLILELPAEFGVQRGGHCDHSVVDRQVIGPFSTDTHYSFGTHPWSSNFVLLPL